MGQEIRNCQNCKQKFIIEPEDFDFYRKIDVPAPTWCPECRLIRRLAFMNERTFYKRACDLCREEVISLFPKDAPRTVYCSKCWWSDAWDPLAYSREYDPTRPFLEQFKELKLAVPDLSRQVMESSCLNSDYCNISSYLKNCYLVFNSDYDEDCLFSTYLERSKNSADLYMADLCEGCYESSNLFKCYNTFYANNCNECVDVYFSKNLIGCANCFGCVNLRSKQYHIFNVAYTKEAYLEEIRKFDLGSLKTVTELKERARSFWLKYPRKYAEGLRNVNVTGDYVFNSKNVGECYEVGDTEDSKYCHFLFLASTKDSYDFTMWGGGAERMYECMACGGGQKDVKFSYETWTNATNVEYSWHILAPCNNLFGCVSLKNKKFCILNKQYSEADYQVLRAKIIRDMSANPYRDSLGREYSYGEFFPPEFSNFSYNETIAQAYFPKSREESIAQGYTWTDSEKKSYNVTLAVKDLPDNIADIPDGVTGEIIECAHEAKCLHQCPSAFKVTPQELEFYRRFNIPLPRLCPNCRHYGRLGERNPIRFYERECMCGSTTLTTSVPDVGGQMSDIRYRNIASHPHGETKCTNKFQTTYPPDQPEMLYCEACYNSEVA